MFRHIVFFKFHEAARSEALEKVPVLLLGLKDKLPFIRSMEIGKDQLRRKVSFDLALDCTFDCLADYLSYDSHPLHAEVKQYNVSVCKEIAAVDFEF